MPIPRAATLAALLITAASSPAAAHHSVSQESSPRLHLTGDIGLTAAFAENLVVAATAIDARVYSSEGVGGLLRVGYEGLLYLNFGVVDLAVAYRHEVPGGQWAGLGLSAAVGLSAMLRDSVYHFTGDDFGLALFGTVGVDLRLGSLLIGLDAIGRWQLAAVPLAGIDTRGVDWTEVGAVIRVGGEVLL